MDNNLCKSVGKHNSCIKEILNKIKKINKRPFVDVSLGNSITSTVTVENEIIIYNNIQSDVCNLYDMNTGCITIPSDGRYLVNFSTFYTIALSGTGTNNSFTSLFNSIIINNETTNRLITSSTIDNNLMSIIPLDVITLDGTKILELNKGDKVKIERTQEINSSGEPIIILPESYFQLQKLL